MRVTTLGEGAWGGFPEVTVILQLFFQKNTHFKNILAQISAEKRVF